MFNTKFLKTLNGSNDSSLHLKCMFSHKHNAHRRPGRLLNVLCTFSLLPVSTGIWKSLQIRNYKVFVMSEIHKKSDAKKSKFRKIA